MDKKYIKQEIIACYNTEDSKKLAKRLGISVELLRLKASRLQIKKHQDYNEIKNNKKRCSRCSKILDISEFRRDRAQPYGYDYNCKKCRKKLMEEAKQKAKNKSKRGKRSQAFKKGYNHNPVVRVNGVDCLKCLECEVIKPLTEFHKASKNISGHMNFCKACRSAKNQNKKRS